MQSNLTEMWSIFFVYRVNKKCEVTLVSHHLGSETLQEQVIDISCHVICTC